MAREIRENVRTTEYIVHKDTYPFLLHSVFFSVGRMLVQHWRLCVVDTRKNLSPLLRKIPWPSVKLVRYFSRIFLFFLKVFLSPSQIFYLSQRFTGVCIVYALDWIMWFLDIVNNYFCFRKTMWCIEQIGPSPPFLEVRDWWLSRG